MEGKKRVFSGIQPSGDIHIGNYLGAIQKWIEIVDQYDSIYCIVDNHAITVDFDPKALAKRTFEAAKAVMACGLDTSKCSLFVQSHVIEHTELAWMFNTVTPLGSLFRMHQFKDKTRSALLKALSKKGGGAKGTILHRIKSVGESALEVGKSLEPDINSLDPEADPDEALVGRLNEGLGNIMQNLQVGLGVSGASTGLFDYPVLQAADILLYKASLVPVGEDQEQHLELCREIAERFNRKFGKTFPAVERIPGEATRILGLDGKQKMSKSLGNPIAVLDPLETIQKKLGRAFTDPNRIRKSDPGRPEICNIFSLHKFFTDEPTRDNIDSECRAGTIGCFDCKKTLAAGINAAMTSIRERSEKLTNDPNIVFEALDQGARRCKGIAEETMEEVRGKIGIGPFALKDIK